MDKQIVDAYSDIPNNTNFKENTAQNKSIRGSMQDDLSISKQRDAQRRGSRSPNIRPDRLQPATFDQRDLRTFDVATENTNVENYQAASIQQADDYGVGRGLPQKSPKNADAYSD